MPPLRGFEGRWKEQLANTRSRTGARFFVNRDKAYRLRSRAVARNYVTRPRSPTAGGDLSLPKWMVGRGRSPPKEGRSLAGFPVFHAENAEGCQAGLAGGLRLDTSEGS
jgi:hypothetical protein